MPAVNENARWSSCVARLRKVLCIGLNYSDHVAEAGMPIPVEPLVFQKGVNTIVCPYGNILIPRKSVNTDCEVELGVVIVKNARYLNTIEEARDYIAGYCVSHDVSEREFQLERSGQWSKGKSCNNFNPLGPFLADADEINDVHMSFSVNGEQMQHGYRTLMVFDCFYLVYYQSLFMILEASDLLNTGTPPRVGLGKKPPQYLKRDMVELSIEGLGSPKQSCINS